MLLLIAHTKYLMILAIRVIITKLSQLPIVYECHYTKLSDIHAKRGVLKIAKLSMRN